jgi:type IV pilus assembly protein PilV
MTDYMSRKNRQRGVGMVEVLIALLVMSVGLLGYAGLQLRALNSTEEAHYRTQAMAIAQDLAERIAANPQSMAEYLSGGNWGQLTPAAGKPNGWDVCLTADCSADQMAASDIFQISWQAALLLPGGQAAAADCDASAAVCVTVSWNDTTPDSCDPPGDDCVRLEVVAWTPDAMLP